jgi:hypothetical protein
VNTFGVSDIHSGSGGNQLPYHQLRIVATDEDGDHEYQFGVEAPFRLGGQLFADEATVSEFAAAVQRVRGGPAAIVSPTYSGLVSAGLTPGMTAFTSARISRRVAVVVYTALGVVLAFAMYGYVVNHTEPRLWALVAIVASTIIRVPFFIAQARSESRERAAGYTTLNRQHLDVEQRHPVTGIVLRAAGAPPLTKDQFVQALGR